jgi:guanylate kinase
MSKKGILFIISAPSGSGKSTLVANLLHNVPNLSFSISYTTRKPRGSETDGIEYYFVNEKDFEVMIEENQFIEYAKVFDKYYGTAKHKVEEALLAGRDVVLDIDTEGAAQVKKKFPESVSIFIMPPSYTALKTRLENRKLDNEEIILKRLGWASQVEIYRFRNYDYVVINEDLDLSLELLKSIVYAERCRTQRMGHRVESIIKTFGGLLIDKQ